MGDRDYQRKRRKKLKELRETEKARYERRVLKTDQLNTTKK